MKIIDIHTHIYPTKIARKATDSVRDFYQIDGGGMDGTVEMLRSRGSQAGISQYVVLPVSNTPSHVRSINDFILSQTERYDDFIGFGTLHAEMEGLTDELERLMALGLHGVKMHPDSQQFAIDDPRIFPLYEAVQGKLPILFHMGDDRYDYSRPEKLARVLRNFPKLKVLAAHFGGYRCWDEARNVLGRNPNVRFDTSSSLPMIPREMARELISYYGVENMFFGTDFPMWSAREELDRFFSLGLSFEDNKKILADNFKEFFGI